MADRELHSRWNPLRPDFGLQKQVCFNPAQDFVVGVFVVHCNTKY